MILNKFFIAGGSVMGTYHRENYKNNQDAYYWAENEYGLSAVVADGCGSGKYSELGARLTARFIGEEALRLLADEKNGLKFRHGLLEELRLNTLKFIKEIIMKLGNLPYEIINDYFLFTIVGAIITEEKTIVFTCGDGIFSVNGKTTVINQNNSPNYLSYSLVPTACTDSDPTALDLTMQKEMPTVELQSVILGTDGVNDLIDNSAKRISILGREELVGDLNQFIDEKKYEKNGSLLQKRLVVLGINHKLLRDDTTLILIKRKAGG